MGTQAKVRTVPCEGNQHQALLCGGHRSNCAGGFQSPSQGGLLSLQHPSYVSWAFWSHRQDSLAETSLSMTPTSQVVCPSRCAPAPSCVLMWKSTQETDPQVRPPRPHPDFPSSQQARTTAESNTLVCRGTNICLHTLLWTNTFVGYDTAPSPSRGRSPSIYSLNSMAMKTKISKVALVQSTCHHLTAASYSALLWFNPLENRAPRWGCAHGPTHCHANFTQQLSERWESECYGRGLGRAAAILALPAPMQPASYLLPGSEVNKYKINSLKIQLQLWQNREANKTEARDPQHIQEQTKKKLICHCCWRADNTRCPCRGDIGGKGTKLVHLKQKAGDKKVKAVDRHKHWSQCSSPQESE